eukprot:CAMPEP_0172708022 /NCGR_PEP_ID=MMETSP1074-20121228/50317_1 /TAXON_ID=2916 /ORGANISM="Ceratium fusus, Strain PA161109" /LENGTH=92 /DNA_ID=CAMNT_0013530907 /DNA_START=544 /DNA_END=822 /DNA_ORIENTATION=+
MLTEGRTCGKFVGASEGCESRFCMLIGTNACVSWEKTTHALMVERPRSQRLFGHWPILRAAAANRSAAQPMTCHGEPLPADVSIPLAVAAAA